MLDQMCFSIDDDSRNTPSLVFRYINNGIIVKGEKSLLIANKCIVYWPVF